MGTTWKAVERKLARLFGVEREGCTGEAGPDFVSASYSVEVKHRKQLPQWIKGALEQAEVNCKDGTMPLVILHERYQGYEDSLVLCRLREFRDWFGE